MPGIESSPEKRNDGWCISLALRWALLFFLNKAYTLFLLGNWGLWWTGLFRPGTASARFLRFPQRLASPYWHGARLALEWSAAHRFHAHIHWGQFWNLAVDVLGYIPLALLWTVFDRRSRSNLVVREALSVVVRLWLATGMFLYGSAKVIGHQGISQPEPLGWLRPLGNISSGEVMWTWLGYSPVFQVFAGINESLGAVLLLFRRTTLLAALLILPVMIYVTALDTTFHVGPGAGAAAYGMGALYLVAREWRRLAQAFVFKRPTAPTPRKKLWTSPWLVFVGRALWILVVVFALSSYVLPHFRVNADIGGRQSPLCGAYQVDRFVKNGQVVPEEAADPGRWRVVSINRFADYIRIRRMDDAEMLWAAYPGDPYRFLVASGHGYRYGDYGRLLAKTTGVREQLRFRALPNFGSPSGSPKLAPGAPQNPVLMAHYATSPFFTLNFTREDADHVLVQGRVDGADISADLRRIDADSFPFLRSRRERP